MGKNNKNQTQQQQQQYGGNRTNVATTKGKQSYSKNQKQEKGSDSCSTC